jgi:hypothetical protein
MGFSALFLEHVVETIRIPTQGADAYLINKVVLVDFFRHDVAMVKAIVNAFSPWRKIHSN